MIWKYHENINLKEKNLKFLKYKNKQNYIYKMGGCHVGFSRKGFPAGTVDEPIYILFSKW